MSTSDMSRTCGECTMCCKLLAVEELDKPAGSWCKLVQIGKGCGDYENRPASCRAFECMWLQTENISDDMRPDLVRAVLSMTTDGRRIQVHIDPATPDHYKKNSVLAEFIYGVRENGLDVIVVSEKDGKRVFLPSKQNALALASTGHLDI